ncbi:hypothetical protein ACFFMP_06550 [Pseudoroseomonas cervicalis]|uniref:Capsule polysaccharide biosynthesis protein n=1 Tax=Pseudoroseomonas cervicalis ATCC 49957 TaxID=525371 RepID=D5RGL6_9PROT|nr:capsule polysaccharide biosynthesis protein [Pseudoroseomonas cervicalis]EFH13553.1 capsule polysaccharide biosynthesis protein [Pseudoroseomonas cervicalis ATCC 49957]
MPIEDPQAMEFPSPESFAAAYYSGAFRRLVKKVQADLWRCEDPLPYLRFLQLVLRPRWTLAWRPHVADFALMRDGLLAVLEQAQAPLLLHPPQEDPGGEGCIHLSWHTLGRKPRTWHYKAGYLPGMLQCEREGFSGWSELCKLPQKEITRIPAPLAEAHHTRLRRDYAAAGASKWRQDATAPPPAARDYVLVALQLPNDSVVTLKRFEAGYVAGMRAAILALAAAGLPVVVKRHPLCTDRAVAAMLEEVAAHPGVERSAASVHALIPASCCVLTVNSGVGYEALVYDRPVVTLGRADYDRATLALDDPAGAPDAVRRAIARHNPLLARQLVFLAQNVFQIDTRTPLAFQRLVLRALCGHALERPER